jgi:predicted DCC family thiol-disulfide oxidoreductase YuxK
MPDAPLAYPLTVFYDASCPLCREEIETLKARDCDDRLRLVDCSAAAFDERTCSAQGVTRTMMMGRIHARDVAGRWLVGLDVFAAVYGAAGFRRLARIYGSRRLRPLLDRAYPWIATHRYALSRFGLPRLFRLFAGGARPQSTASPDCAACVRPAASPLLPHRDDSGAR